jgi:hypothetical protein
MLVEQLQEIVPEVVRAQFGVRLRSLASGAHDTDPDIESGSA